MKTKPNFETKLLRLEKLVKEPVLVQLMVSHQKIYFCQMSSRRLEQKGFNFDEESDDEDGDNTILSKKLTKKIRPNYLG